MTKKAKEENKIYEKKCKKCSEVFKSQVKNKIYCKTCTQEIKKGTQKRKKKIKTFEIIDKFYTILDIKKEIKKRGVEEVSDLTGFPVPMITNWMTNVYSPSEIQGDILRKKLFKLHRVVKILDTKDDKIPANSRILKS